MRIKSNPLLTIPLYLLCFAAAIHVATGRTPPVPITASAPYVTQITQEPHLKDPPKPFTDDELSWPINLSAPYFTEITSDSQLNDDPAPLPDGTYSLPEIMGGGVSIFDYDNDGDLDLLQIVCPPPGKPDRRAPNRLYRQLPDGTYRNVASAAGLDDPGYGQGAAVGDTDNDGDLDVYVTNFGRDTFYLNNGDGTFVDATVTAGFSGDHWSSSAAFFDYDRDGDLDLYVVRYLLFDSGVTCRSRNDRTVYCGPQSFEGVLDALYRNNGDGSFSDVTAAVGIAAPGKGLGVVCADLTEDGWVDIYVANDQEANHLWVNNGDGTFTDEAVMRGVAFNAYGEAEASMGVTVGDVNGDGRLDLFMTHLRDETNTLYTATEYGIFVDTSEASGLAAVDRGYTGFGCGFFDYDNDGDLDLALVNGAVRRGSKFSGANVGEFWNLYAEPNLLFQNNGSGVFTHVSALAGAFANQVEVSRGLAFGDVDLDGDVDLVVGNLNGMRVFRNDAPPPGNHWLRVRAMDGNRDAIGAEVTVVTADAEFVGLILPGYSYLGSSQIAAHFGLGTTEIIESIEVKWQDGSRERFKPLGIDQELTLRKGSGDAL